jgi:predicted nucleic acid-binding protein
VKISETLSELRLLYIETGPFIYFTERRPVYTEKMRVIFRYIYSKQLSVITSTISLSETLTKPMKTQDVSLITAYTQLFEDTEGISMMPVSAAIARTSAYLRAQYGLKTPDALHVATALALKCDGFLTNDFGLKRVNNIPVFVLDELELDGFATHDEGKS